MQEMIENSSKKSDIKRKPVREKQLSFESNEAFKDHKKRFEHGDEIRKGQRKLARPFDPNKCLHLKLKSTRAKGAWSFLKSKNENKIARIVFSHAEKSGVKIYKYANVGNYIHILLKARSKKGFQRFLRIISGVIPRIVTNAKKGKPIGKFWDGLAYTKLVNWGKHFKNTISYVWRNALEGWGVIPPREQDRGLFKLNFLDLFPQHELNTESDTG